MSSITSSLHLVDPEFHPVLEVFQGFDFNLETLPMLRMMPAPPPLDSPAFEEAFIPRKGGGDDLRLVVITPDIEKPPQGLPALLYMHGGGFVIGSPETILPTVQRLAQDVGCVVVLPAYRLAPEAIFPAALDDNFLALSWLYQTAEELGVDARRVAIGGDSAGGGHAAVLGLTARDRGANVPIFQLLIYPMLDDRTGSAHPASPLTGEFIWTAENNVFGWNSYLGCPAGGESIPEGAVPARREDLSGLPPTLIATASLDLFIGENEQFANRLSEQGVSVDIQVFEGGIHGFNVILPEAKISQNFHKLCVNSLKNAFDI